MRTSTQIHWRFRNSGFPDSTQLGTGTWPDMVKSLARWMNDETMGNKITVDVSRTPLDADGDVVQDVTAELDAFLTNIGQNESEAK